MASTSLHEPYVVGPRHRDLMGFQVNRVWPTARRRLVGPFIFLDHMMPVHVAADRGLDVPPHPHIGLATVTWLFSGELVHRDSLGTEQLIRPGDLNWMTAGSGITHSERSSPRDRARTATLHGIQCWVALPRALETCAPSFEHYSAVNIPAIHVDGVKIRLIAGSAFAQSSPVTVSSPLFLLDLRFDGGRNLEVPTVLGQRAVYVVSGNIQLAGQMYSAGQLVVWPDDQPLSIQAASTAHCVVFGGASLSEDRYIWWNFVATQQALIDAARLRWDRHEFPVVPGESELMPMPRN